MKRDAADRSKIQGALVTTFIYLVKPETHTEIILVNICSSEEARSDVNINTLEIGAKDMIRFQESVPDGSKTTFKTQIVTVSTTK